MNFNQLLSIYDDPENRSLENPNLDRVRHNVYTPEGEKALKLFDKAVGLMKERSTQNKADPMGWNYQAGIHGIWNLDYEQPDTLESNQAFVDFAEQISLSLEWIFDTNIIKITALTGTTA